MARGDSLFCRIEIEFLRSHEWLTLSPSTRNLYLYLWGYAVEVRRETLQRPSNKILAGQAGIAANKVEIGLSSLSDTYRISTRYPSDKPLITFSSDIITVHGVASKHAKLKGWPDPYGERKGPIRAPIREEKRREENPPIIPQGKEGKKKLVPEYKSVSQLPPDLKEKIKKIGKKF